MQYAHIVVVYILTTGVAGDGKGSDTVCIDVLADKMRGRLLR